MQDTMTVPKLEMTFSPITLAQAIEQAPAIAATKAHERVTKRYNFVSTMDIIENMDRLGWSLTAAKQSSSKVPMYRDFGVHILTFQRPDLYVKNGEGGVEARPSVVFINSHDGTRPLQTELGIFRLVCSNGLIVKSQSFGGFRERHSKLDLEATKKLIDEKLGLMTPTVQKMTVWSDTQMKALDVKKFAESALKLRVGEDRAIEEHEIRGILEAKRKEDSGNTLWKVFNRVQENLTKGGFMLGERQARGIKNPVADLVLNQGLWQLAEEFEPTV